jgi:hypothetical protein
LLDVYVNNPSQSTICSNVILMQFNTPASITIRSYTQSFRVDFMEKKKRLEYHVPVSEETSNPMSVPIFVFISLSSLDNKLVLSNSRVLKID